MSETLLQAKARLSGLIDKWSNIVNGPVSGDGSMVDTDSGAVETAARAINELATGTVFATRLAALEANEGAPGLNVDNFADLTLAHDAGTVAYVNFDADITLRGKYIKLLGNGVGSWHGPVDDNLALRLHQLLLLDAWLDFPFMTVDPYMSGVIRKIRLFGLKPGHQYFVYQFRTSATNFDVTIKDLTEDAVVAAINIAMADIADLMFFDPRALGGVVLGAATDYSGIYGVVEIDQAAIVETGSLFTYTTLAESGINLNNCMTRDQVASRFWNDQTWQEVIRVAVGDLRDIVVALWAEGDYDAPGDPWVRWCWRAMPDYRILLDLAAGDHEASNLYIPHNVDIRGQGPGVTTIKCEDHELARANVQGHLSHKLLDLTILADAALPTVPNIVTDKAQYGWHRDRNNEFSTPDATGFVNFWCGFDAHNVEFVGGALNNFAVAGMGISSGERVRFTDCWARSENPDRSAPFFASHTCFESVETGTLEFKNCGVDPLPGIAAVAVQSEQPDIAPAHLTINGCPSFNLVASSGAVADGWTGSGDYTGPVYNSDSGAYLDFSTTATLKNGTGATITATALCKITDGVEVALAADGDPVDAVALTAVTAGSRAKFSVARRVDLRVVGLVGTEDGPVFVAAGVATMAPTGSGKAIGRARGGALHLFDYPVTA